MTVNWHPSDKTIIQKNRLNYSMKDIKTQALISAQKKANINAKKLIRVLGLDDVVVRQNKVIQIKPDGTEIAIKDSKFVAVKGKKGTFTLKK